MLFMVPLDSPSARPMAQMLRLPFEYYIVLACEDRDSGGLSSSIVPQEGSDLTFIHVEPETIHSYFPFIAGYITTATNTILDNVKYTQE